MDLKQVPSCDLIHLWCAKGYDKLQPTKYSILNSRALWEIPSCFFFNEETCDITKVPFFSKGYYIFFSFLVLPQQPTPSKRLWGIHSSLCCHYLVMVGPCELWPTDWIKSDPLTATQIFILTHWWHHSKPSFIWSTNTASPLNLLNIISYNLYNAIFKNSPLLRQRCNCLRLKIIIIINNEKNLYSIYENWINVK